MLRVTFLKASLENIAVVTSQERHNLNDFVEKFFARLFPAVQFAENFAVFDKQNALAVAGGKRIVRNN